MERLGDSSAGIEWQLAFDNVTVVRESIIEVLKTLAKRSRSSFRDVPLLQNWRSTLIPAITILSPHRHVRIRQAAGTRSTPHLSALSWRQASSWTMRLW